MVGIAEKDGDLIENDIVYRLGTPTVLTETSWIRPGKVAWDWWNANNVYGVPFRSGINTATYKYYIDFAAANRIEYVIFDEGWSKPADLLAIDPGHGHASPFRYAQEEERRHHPLGPLERRSSEQDERRPWTVSPPGGSRGSRWTSCSGTTRRW